MGEYCLSTVRTNHTCAIAESEGNPIIRPLLDGLMKVDAESNYRLLFDDVDGLDSLKAKVLRLPHITRRKDEDSGEFELVSYKPQYTGEMVELVAAYDQVVSSQIFVIFSYLILIQK